MLFSFALHADGEMDTHHMINLMWLLPMENESERACLGVLCVGLCTNAGASVHALPLALAVSTLLCCVVDSAPPLFIVFGDLDRFDQVVRGAQDPVRRLRQVNLVSLTAVVDCPAMWFAEFGLRARSYLRA